MGTMTAATYTARRNRRTGLVAIRRNGEVVTSVEHLAQGRVLAYQLQRAEVVQAVVANFAGCAEFDAATYLQTL